ncbi:MAG: cobalamin-binding protein [Candidatus Kapabacteria bacterium]|nr:cobalamin-binding protein [Candidatus Kapabacteria bacterium]
MISLKPSKPQRIICMTEETTETLYRIGADELIVGITEYTVRPPRAKLEKPVISRYLDADIDSILNLKPDIVLAWSDLQADIVRELIKKGIEVYCFNHRSVEGILSMILKLGSLVGYESQAVKLTDELITNIRIAESESQNLKYRPKVYFEEWFSPLITGICWVSEIIEICGGVDVFSENRVHQDAKGRILENDSEVIRRNPDIMLASWCGKPFRKNTVLKRKGWNEINAVKNDAIYDIDAGIILQPGPATLSDGINIIKRIVQNHQGINKK